MAKKADCKAKVKDLEKAMLDADVNGEGLADSSGLSPNTVSTVRQGRPVSRSRAMAIAGALGKPFSEIFEAEA